MKVPCRVLQLRDAGPIPLPMDALSLKLIGGGQNHGVESIDSSWGLF